MAQIFSGLTIVGKNSSIFAVECPTPLVETLICCPESFGSPFLWKLSLVWLYIQVLSHDQVSLAKLFFTFFVIRTGLFRLPCLASALLSFALEQRLDDEPLLQKEQPLRPDQPSLALFCRIVILCFLCFPKFKCRCLSSSVVNVKMQLRSLHEKISASFFDGLA